MREVANSPPAGQAQLAKDGDLQAAVPFGVKRPQVGEVLGDCEPLGHILVFRDIAYPAQLANGDLARINPQHVCAAARRLQDVYKQLDRRGFTRAIRADQCIGIALPHCEAQAAKSLMASEFFPKSICMDHLRATSVLSNLAHCASMASIRSSTSSPTRFASTTSCSTSCSRRRFRSPARAGGRSATTVPTPGRTSNHRS